ncbi:DUF1671-domain-containing protein [Sarocladium strictum]
MAPHDCRPDDANEEPRVTSRHVNLVPERAQGGNSGGVKQGSSVSKAWRELFSRSRASDKTLPKRKSNRPRPRRIPEKTETTANEDDLNLSALENRRDLQESPASRLGKAELGRYAHEEAMPRSLRTLLQGRGESNNSGIITVLSKLLKVDPSTKLAYLCDPCVQHVAKMSREGSFCGYRNLQMLISYIINAQAPGAHLFSERYPTILQIQDLIENAWDHGHNSHGRQETGGIRGTRKFIGTPEAQALFCGLGIRCSSQAFRNDEPGRAAKFMLNAVAEYFKKQPDPPQEQKVYRTKAAPIYLQHQGHSLTIVGIEEQKDGDQSLIVFDPAHRDSSTMKTLAGAPVRRLPTTPSRLLRPYRCSIRYLRKYKEFELLL